MDIFDHLSKEDLIDLIKAYDSYIVTAADAGRLTSGWVPVCISEFYSCEYQNIWRQGETFDYMYDYMEKEQAMDGTPSASLPVFNNVQVFFDHNQLMCRFEGEDRNRPVRSRIQDISDGDAFFIGTGLHYADGDAHQNFDEPDDCWIVYDAGGDCWFEEDIVDPFVRFPSLQSSPGRKNPSLSDQIQAAGKKATQQINAVSPTELNNTVKPHKNASAPDMA